MLFLFMRPAVIPLQLSTYTGTLRRRVLEKIGEHGRRRRNPPRPESLQCNNGAVAGRDLETIFGAARTGEKIRRGEHAR